MNAKTFDIHAIIVSIPEISVFYEQSDYQLRLQFYFVRLT